MESALEVSAFKHVLVPIGVVIALGVARLVSTASSYIQHRDRVRFSAAHAVWSTALFLLFVGLWWVVWGFRHADARVWTYFTLIFLLLGPCLLFLATTVLSPDLPDRGELDLGAALDRRLGRPFFLCLIGVIVWLVLAESWLLDDPLWSFPKRLFQTTAVAIFGVGAAFPSRRMAGWLAALALPLVIVALATVRAKLA